MEPRPPHDRGAGITDLPLPPLPPWELPGNFRRDCEPHRAGLLRLLGALSLGLGVLDAVVVLLFPLPLDTAVWVVGPVELTVYGLVAATALAGTLTGTLTLCL